MKKPQDSASQPVEHVRVSLSELTQEQRELVYSTVNPYYAPMRTHEKISSNPHLLKALNAWRTSHTVRLFVTVITTFLIIAITSEIDTDFTDVLFVPLMIALWGYYALRGRTDRPALNSGGYVDREQSSPEFLAVEHILLRALKGDRQALDTNLSIVTTGSTPYFALENINRSWYACPEHQDGAERLVADLLITRQVEKMKATKSLEPQPSDIYQRDAALLLGELDAADLNPEISTKAHETVRVLGHVEKDMPAGSEHVIESLRADTLSALQVITTISPENMEVPLPSGMTAIEEFNSIMDSSCQEAKRLTSLSQLSKADELSFLRRVQDQRLRRSTLNLDD